MQNTTFPARRLPTLHDLASFGWRLLGFWRRPAPDAHRVAHLAQAAAQHPALRHWLLVAASEPPRLQRALLARAAQALPGRAEASALEQLMEAPLLHAVTEALLRQQGLAPLPPAQRTGRGARVRLSELAERLQASDALPLAA